MTAATQSLRLEETLLEPPALPPPPTRHAFLAILIALATLLHVATIGSGDLYSETEGQYAGAAREMVESHQWLLPTNDGIPRLQKPPLLYWLIIISFKLFGVNAAAARLPVALAVVASVALIFLIGEKLTDYWRGFIAGLIYLSFCGTFLLARFVWLSAAAASACLVRRILDLLGLRLLDQRFARRPLSGGDSCIAVNFLSRSTSAISRAFAVGICSNLSLDSCSLAYLGGIAFSGLLSVSGQYGMVGTSARIHRRDA